MKNKEFEFLIVKIIGWIGTLLIMLAYTLISFEIIFADNFYYPILNLFGAIFIGIRVYYEKIWSNVFLEIFFGAVAIITLVKIFY